MVFMDSRYERKKACFYPVYSASGEAISCGKNIGGMNYG
jgi:hypothetical protein